MKEYKNVTGNFPERAGLWLVPFMRGKEVLELVFYINDWLNVLFFQIFVCFAQLLN